MANKRIRSKVGKRIKTKVVDCERVFAPMKAAMAMAMGAANIYKIQGLPLSVSTPLAVASATIGTIQAATAGFNRLRYLEAMPYEFFYRRLHKRY